MQTAPTFRYPAPQVKSQLDPLQTGTALAGVAHPAQVRWQDRKPALQVNAHAVPLHVTTALLTAGHAIHVFPHELTDALLTQL
jgi:hypothetical protein